MEEEWKSWKEVEMEEEEWKVHNIALAFTPVVISSHEPSSRPLPRPPKNEIGLPLPRTNADGEPEHEVQQHLLETGLLLPPLMHTHTHTQTHYIHTYIDFG